MIGDFENKPTFDRSMRLTGFDQEVSPLYALHGERWKNFRKVAPSFVDFVDYHYPIAAEDIYRVDIPFRYGRGRSNQGDLRLTFSPVPSSFVSRLFAAFDPRSKEISPYAPLGFKSTIEMDPDRQEVTMNPAYFLMKVDLLQIPRMLMGDVDSTRETDLEGKIFFPHLHKDVIFLPTDVENRNVSTTGFEDEYGKVANKSEYLLLPHVEEMKNMSVSLRRIKRQ